MSTRVRRYDPETDFMRVRDFLKRTGKAYGRPLNWKIDRWNYARYFVAPYLGGDGRDDEAGSVAASSARRPRRQPQRRPLLGERHPHLGSGVQLRGLIYRR